jgi:beta-1,2-mannobiose phosphorylase / 1,2-beta-oligomannan phosphorylase
MDKFFFAYFLVLVFMIAGCSSNTGNGNDHPGIFPSELVNFIPYENNPVFTGTGSNTWDQRIRERGYILHEDGIYKMWYTGYNDQVNPTKFLGLATSDDGYHWTRYEGNPIFDEYWTEDVHVVKHEGLYYMVAEGVDDVAHMLTSRDGINWQRAGDLDVRKVNGDPIDSGAYGTPTLWIEDEKWFLFYEREDLGIWLAASADQRIWTNIQDEPVISLGPGKYDSEAVALNQIIKYKDKYYAYYHGSPDEDWATWNSNVAASDDLIHWIKFEGNPILGADSLSRDVSSPILVHDGDQYRLYTMHDKVRVFLPAKN